MNNFFKSFNQNVSINDLDEFLIKLGANLAAPQPDDLLFGALFGLYNESKQINFS